MLMSKAGAELQINITAVAENWLAARNLLANQNNEGICAAVLKADSYGLGADKISPALYQAGCRDFFVAYLFEGVKLRQILGKEPRIFAIHGNFAGEEKYFDEYDIVPVLNTLSQIRTWREYNAKAGKNLPCALHFDTGMTRLGFTAEDREILFSDTDILKSLNVTLVMSHLSDGGDCGKKGGKSSRQLALFKKIKTNICKILDYKPLFSLSASAGMLIGGEYMFDLIRPGACLYGFFPDEPSDKISLKNVVSLNARVLQVQNTTVGQTVGYGSSYTFTKNGKVLTAALGYADGYFRSLGNKGCAWLSGCKLPVIGRVSMDLTTFDASDVPDEVLAAADMIEIIGEHITLNEVAERAGTIPYEIITDLGGRYRRSYINDAAKEQDNSFADFAKMGSGV